MREVVFVDGVRTPFGKAGEKGIYAQTRADDLVIRCIRELLERNPDLPPEKVEEVAIAATTQIGDQGLTLGRMAALLSGLPNTTPGYSVDRMCAGAMTAVTNVAGAISFGAIDVAIAVVWVAYAVLFFMSDESVYVTAQTLAVDSGLSGM
mgnify:CR=1 FL=1